MLALLGTLVAGCGGSDDASSAVRTPPSTRYRGLAGGLRVAIAGDSITALSRDRIVGALTDRYRVRVDAYSGRTIAEVSPAIVRQVRTRPDVEVVNLGTNDLDRENPHWRPDLDRMLRLVAGVPCVVAVTIYDGRHLPVDANIGTKINARLTAAAAKGSVHLVDWNAAVHRDPGLIVADGIHPDRGGQRWIARSIREAIDSDC